MPWKAVGYVRLRVRWITQISGLSIKVTKRRGYGIRKFSAFRRRVLIALGLGHAEVVRLTLRDVSKDEGAE